MVASLSPIVGVSIAAKSLPQWRKVWQDAEELDKLMKRRLFRLYVTVQFNVLHR